jgi:RNA polymerase sigma-70 factor, ECF subfamily
MPIRRSLSQPQTFCTQKDVPGRAIKRWRGRGRNYIIRLDYPTPMARVRDLPVNFSSDGVYFSQDEADHTLVARCLAGDTAAFEPIVERYQRVLFTVARRMLGDTEQAADATQNAFVSAYRKLGTFDPKRRFFSWIYRILVNECLNDRRARRPHEPLSPQLAAAGTPADLLEAEERRRSVQAAVLALPTEYREVVILRHFTGLSYDEIADALGLPAKTVKSRLHTARQRLGEMLLGWDALK